MKNFTKYMWRELDRLQKKYNLIIRYNPETNIYYVYTKSGKLEFTACGMQDLISTLHLYYD